MTGQQEIGDSFLDRVLMPTVPAGELSARDARLHEQSVQILERLRRLATFVDERLCGWWLGGQVG